MAKSDNKSEIRNEKERTDRAEKQEKADKAEAVSGALAREVMKVCEALEAKYGRRKSPPFADYIEALSFQILELGVNEKSSREALLRLRTEYIDWNDMRVATIREIEDILGPRYYKVREKAEDLKHLLGDLYTAFRRMDVTEQLAKGEGIETLRALPDVTNIRRDMVDRALLLALGMKVLPCDEEQFRLLKHLGGVPKPWTVQQGMNKLEEALDLDQLARLSRVLREHVHAYQQAGFDEPQDIAFESADDGKPRVEKKPKSVRPLKPLPLKVAQPDMAQPDMVEASPEVEPEQDPGTGTVLELPAGETAAVAEAPAADEKPAAKKPAAKKPAAKKPAAPKPAAKKPAAKKPATKKPAGKSAAKPAAKSEKIAAAEMPEEPEKAAKPDKPEAKASKKK